MTRTEILVTAAPPRWDRADMDLNQAVDDAARASGFSGAVRVDVEGTTRIDAAYGLANRAEGIANTPGTRFGVASASKGFTALVVASLVEEGLLTLGTTARSLLGEDLPLVADDVTVEHLLGHRSGIGDYLDEDVLDDTNAYVMPVPVHELVETSDFLRVLAGFETKFPAGERFSYCNGGYVVLALLAERASGRGYHDLVQERVLDPAGLADTGFPRTDELPGGTATGYLHPDEAHPHRLRSNVFHLPARATGDGGAYTTTGDVHRFWHALHEGRILPAARVEHLTTGRPTGPDEPGYGLGFWVPAPGCVQLVGADAGSSFWSRHHPGTSTTWTVVSNVTDGAWPVARRVRELVDGG